MYGEIRKPKKDDPKHAEQRGVVGAKDFLCLVRHPANLPYDSEPKPDRADRQEIADELQQLRECFGI